MVDLQFGSSFRNIFKIFNYEEGLQRCIVSLMVDLRYTRCQLILIQRIVHGLSIINVTGQVCHKYVKR